MLRRRVRIHAKIMGCAKFSTLRAASRREISSDAVRITTLTVRVTQALVSFAPLREGAVLSPVLYAVFIDDIARRLAASCSGVSVGGAVVRLRGWYLCHRGFSRHETENTEYRYLLFRSSG